ncbi:MAG: hypothetical protein M1829_005070 [Trizodia sp. TS-e1964]|nr:MAG: hypothetical protein M1829_005070 [Trizodia sp. TS-e1964]
MISGSITLHSGSQICKSNETAAILADNGKLDRIITRPEHRIQTKAIKGRAEPYCGAIVLRSYYLMETSAHNITQMGAVAMDSSTVWKKEKEQLNLPDPKNYVAIINPRFGVRERLAFEAAEETFRRPNAPFQLQ